MKFAPQYGQERRRQEEIQKFTSSPGGEKVGDVRGRTKGYSCANASPGGSPLANRGCDLRSVPSHRSLARRGNEAVSPMWGAGGRDRIGPHDRDPLTPTTSRTWGPLPAPAGKDAGGGPPSPPRGAASDFDRICPALECGRSSYRLPPLVYAAAAQGGIAANRDVPRASCPCSSMARMAMAHRFRAPTRGAPTRRANCLLRKQEFYGIATQSPSKKGGSCCDRTPRRFAQIRLEERANSM